MREECARRFGHRKGDGKVIGISRSQPLGAEQFIAQRKPRRLPARDDATERPV
jgi:hypothetical protein